MKACVLTNKNIIEYKDVENPQVKDGEVLLKVKACGICSSDFNRVYKDSAYFYPIILGHEFCGEIVECGKNVDLSLLGKKVAVFPLLPCKECEFCKSKHYAQCVKYSYFGSRQNGAMAEYIAVPVWNLKLLPNDMEYSVAALCEPAAVAVHTIRKIGEIKDKTVAISGTGAIGIICGLVAKSKGADVVFIIRSDSKKEFLKTLGFEKFIYIDDDCINSFDVTIECVGTNSSVHNCINFVKSRGLIVAVGNPESDIELEKKLYWKILRSEITFKGIWNSEYNPEADKDDWDLAIEFLYEHQTTVKKLVTDRFSLNEGIKAFEKMKNGNKIALKGVFINEK